MSDLEDDTHLGDVFDSDSSAVANPLSTGGGATTTAGTAVAAAGAVGAVGASMALEVEDVDKPLSKRKKDVGSLSVWIIASLHRTMGKMETPQCL